MTFSHLRLIKVDGDARAEGRDGLLEYSALGQQAQADLGPNAPDPQSAAALAERIQQIDATRAATMDLLTYLNQIDAIAMHDLSVLSLDVDALYRANVSRNPAIATRYRRLQLFINSRGRAISDGIAAARALEEAEKSGK